MNDPRLRQARPGDRRPDRPDRRRRRTIDTRFLGFTVSPHEECAVEEAVRIVEAHGGSAHGPDARAAEAEEQLRDAMAIGDRPRRSCSRPTGAEWDPVATAARDRRGDPGAGGRQRTPFDLILFGNEAADTGGFQVGDPGRARARPAGRHRDQGARDRATAMASRGARPRGGWEVYELPLPAVLAVKEGINLPRYPSVPGRLRAKKKADRADRRRRGRAGGLDKVRLRLPEERGARRSRSSGRAGGGARGRRAAAGAGVLVAMSPRPGRARGGEPNGCRSRR